MNVDLGYLGRSGLAAWGFELPFPAVDVGLNSASLAESEEIHGAFGALPVARYQRHGISSRAHWCSAAALPALRCRPLHAGDALRKQNCRTGQEKKTGSHTSIIGR